MYISEDGDEGGNIPGIMKSMPSSWIHLQRKRVLDPRVKTPTVTAYIASHYKSVDCFRQTHLSYSPCHSSYWT